MDEVRRRSWAEIDLGAAEYNFKQIKAVLKPGVRFCCVVKADAYGHGAVELAKLYESLGADWFAVSNIEEALQLRLSDVSLPILVLGYTPVGCAELLAKYNISQCMYSYDYAKALSSAAVAAKVSVSVHVKFDTGMGRIGFRSKGDEHDELDLALAACGLPGIMVEGAFTHFAVADESDNGEAFTRCQYQNFVAGTKYLEDNGVRIRIKHCANSAAIFDYPEYQLDMVRAGVILYGVKPSDAVKNLPALKPVMTLRSVISHIKTVYSGESISYGCVFKAERPMRVATIPIGYADGFWRANYKPPYSLLVNGYDVPILGKVCMDQLMVDVTDARCEVGDIVTVFGSEPGHTADDIASVNGTINYEVLCAVGARVPRAYVRDGKTLAWRDHLYGDESV